LFSRYRAVPEAFQISDRQVSIVHVHHEFSCLPPDIHYLCPQRFFPMKPIDAWFRRICVTKSRGGFADLVFGRIKYKSPVKTRKPPKDFRCHEHRWPRLLITNSGYYLEVALRTSENPCGKGSAPTGPWH